MTELPAGWKEAELDDLVAPSSHALAIGPFGSNLKVSDYQPSGTPLVFVRNIRARDFDLVPTFVSEQKAADLAAHSVVPGDVLVTKMGDPPGDVAIYPAGRPQAILTADCIKATPHPAIAGWYLGFAIQSPDCAGQIGEMTSGVAQQKVSLAKIRRLRVPLAPQAEQQRIVAAIEEAFSKLDAGEAGLRTVRQLLKRMRDAVLAAAVTGCLVPHDPTDTPASKLLAGLGIEALDSSALGLLPESWAWASMGDVTAIGGGIQKQPKRTPSRNPTPFLRVANVGRGTLDLDDVRLIEVFDGELDRYGLERGDLLVVEGNGSPDQIGRSAMWHGSIDPCVHQNHLIRVRPSNVLLPEFLELYWNSPAASRRVQAVASSTSGLHTLSTGKLKVLPRFRHPRNRLESSPRSTARCHSLTPASRESTVVLPVLRRCLLAVIYTCQVRQEWYRDHQLLNGEPPLDFVGSARVSDPVEPIAEGMGALLAWTAASRARCRTWDQALTWLREQAEAAGVLVSISGIVGSDTHRRLDPQEFRGFALVDPYASVVFVNGADSKAAQVFTLAHELAHRWLGETALSDLDPRSTDANTVERWCNQVAAELLVPMAEFRNVFDPALDVREQLQALAERFRVSTQVILGPAREAEALTWDRYLQELESERARIAALVVERGAGGNYYNTKPVQIGKRFERAIVASALEGQTSYTEAFRMLGLKKAATFDELAQRLAVV